MASMPGIGFGGVPISVLTDSYKATHFLQYPKATKMVAVSSAGRHSRIVYHLARLPVAQLFVR